MYIKDKLSLSFKKGSAMVEIIVGVSIMLVGILVINTSYSTYMQYALSNQRNVEASYLLSEGLEAISLFRDDGWLKNISGFSTTTTYYLSFNGTKWATTTTPQYVDGFFLRAINLFDVKRDANDDITLSGGTYDSNIKLVTVTISYWQGHGTTTRTMSRYIVNIK